MLAATDLGALIAALRRRDFTVVGPTVRDGAIVYDELPGVEALPAGWTDDQDAGRYRLGRRGDRALFGYAVGPHSWKRFLHPPRERLWRLHRTGEVIEPETAPTAAAKYAFLGVRGCELAAIAIQDKVLLGGELQDSGYRSRREEIFIVAVNCAVAGGTCFCASMDAGPRVRSGFDLALTELVDDSRHDFVVEAGTDRGAEVLAELSTRAASSAELEAAEAQSRRTAAQMGRRMDTAGIKALLQENAEHPRWDEVASRCLACGNCTLVCPTCFCTTVEDSTDLAGAVAERWRRWDSCFALDFAYVHGGSIRGSVKARYRQWLTHKLAHWIDQFGTSGCVGCGRCITWCPAGIDITEEVAAIRAGAATAAEGTR